MATLLLVQHAPALPGLLAALQGGHEVDVAPTLASARTALLHRSYDAVVLDADQPDGDGMELVAELRAARTTATLPVLVVTDRSDVTAKVLGFAVGCDDWLSQQVHPLELRARLGARLRAHHEHADLGLQGLHIDLTRQRAWVVDAAQEQTPMQLTTLEFKLLVHFAQHVDHVIERDRLLDAIWGHHVAVLDRTVDTHVSHLRRKLASSPWTIEAVPRLGYRFTHVAC